MVLPILENPLTVVTSTICHEKLLLELSKHVSKKNKTENKENVKGLSAKWPACPESPYLQGSKTAKGTPGGRDCVKVREAGEQIQEAAVLTLLVSPLEHIPWLTKLALNCAN